MHRSRAATAIAGSALSSGIRKDKCLGPYSMPYITGRMEPEIGLSGCLVLGDLSLSYGIGF